MAGDGRLEWLRERAAPLFSEGRSEIVFEDEQTIASFFNEGEAQSRLSNVG